MNHLTRHDYAAALRLLGRIESQADDVDAFARAAVTALNGYVASEFATLSVRDLRTDAQRSAGDLPSGRAEPEEGVCVGREHAIAVQLFLDANTRVAIVLNRSKLGFGERDRERLELLRPHLAFLYGHARRATAHEPGAASARPQAPALKEAPQDALTLRERDVLRWLACGKTDTEIAALLSISPRTVHKHLEHIYVKLGVETRTAAVMRMLAERAPDAVLAIPPVDRASHGT